MPGGDLDVAEADAAASIVVTMVWRSVCGCIRGIRTRLPGPGAVGGGWRRALEATSSERIAYVGLRLDSDEPVLMFVLGNAGDVVKCLIADRTARGREIVAMVQAARAKRPAGNP